MKIIRLVFLTAILNLVLFTIGSAEEKEPVVLDEVVVTATKYETFVKDVPASVTIITSEEIEKQNLPNGDIGDVLRQVPGITLRRAYAPFLIPIYEEWAVIRRLFWLTEFQLTGRLLKPYRPET
ncbi:MAG: TonB-dependent receptor plug domain-containing protein [Thermodesulfobacteriota bacterium]|nr:TonB-dependent receptor plug domain-containing protein [Thermodesulfobacteriota bacterium]